MNETIDNGTERSRPEDKTDTKKTESDRWLTDNEMKAKETEV